MRKTIDYQRIIIKEGIELHLLPTSKFKTTLMKVFIQERLRKETAPMVALISYILFRGTVKRPTTLEMMRYLEGLYGADFSADVDKRGECQFLTLTLEVINQHYLPGGDNLLDEGLAFLLDVLTNPLTKDGIFKQEYFEQEKNILKDDINSLMNDKSRYAYERCKQLMCAEEPYGIYKYGSLEDLEQVENQQLFDYYQTLLQNNPIHIWLAGDLDIANVKQKVSETFKDFAPRSAVFEPVVADKEDVSPQRVIEEENIRQGKLSIGYRTRLTRRNPLYPAMIVFNGIFGSLPHSKLFQNVREKASLAYYIHSGLDGTKGIIQVDCGIESTALDQVLAIVDKQLDDIIQGEVTLEELEFTKKAYSRYFNYITDDNDSLIDSCMVEISNGLEPILDEFAEELESVTLEDVRKVARHLELDTIYFLKGKEGGDDEFDDDAEYEE